ncbi:hypothetical protein EWI61_04390 [Methylolobus aquaticus]|nr:hypothetical protein EWI61_04390 [Methylolobus aquaticus]
MSERNWDKRGEAICARLVTEMHKLGFMPGQLRDKPVYAQAAFETSRDPYSGMNTLCASWKNATGARVGLMKFHGDGSFYAEYDVVQPHPRDPRWFVESVVAWGRDEVIKSEAKLLPALGE